MKKMAGEWRMSEKACHVRIDQERFLAETIIELGRSVYVQSEMKFFTNSRCVAEEVAIVAHTGTRWSECSAADRKTELQC